MVAEQKCTTEVAIQFLNGPLAEKTFSIRKPVIMIGRDRQNDIVVLDLSVSRHHARICWLDNTWTIENLSQNSDVSIDHQPAPQGKLQHNSLVSLGDGINFVFLIQQPIAVQPSESSLATQLAIPHAAVSPMESMALEVPSTIPAVSGLPVKVPLTVSPSSTVLAPRPEIRQPSLTVSSNIHSEVRVHLLNKPVLNIGRDAENDIVIAEPIVSTWHAQLVREGKNLVLVHPHPSREQTLNGLWYQGQRVRGDQPFRKQLVSGDFFRIGDEHGTLITFTYDDGAGAPSATLPEMQSIPLTGDRLTIGRTTENTVVLNHPQVSAHHALLEKVEGGYRISDTNSTNHVYVNGQLTSEQLLRTGDEMRIGPFRLTYTGTELKPYDESSHIRIDALHLKKVGNNHVILLNDISLVIPPRKFVALVGGSGAGKSTLMDALNGLRPAHHGTVLYNGMDYYHHLATFSTQLGYVPQDDIVHRDLTVERALYYAARLRLPSDFTREQIAWRINEVLEDVEMTDRRALLVSKLSGGQRKRVSIALELLANPGVFFLDEPTSGLDPGLDRKMMALLRRLADRGRTIILVTHATNNINVCDYVCFLAQGGRLAYFGPPNEAKAYFEKTDFAEIYSTLEPTKEHPDIPEQAEARFLASPDYQQYVAEPLIEGQTGPIQPQSSSLVQPAAKKTQRQVRRGQGWSQFLLLSTRYLELLKNDRVNLAILLLQAPIIGILLLIFIKGVGPGGFNPNNVLQCPSTAAIIAPGGFPDVPTPLNPVVSTSCQRVEHFLQNNPAGIVYAKQQGGTMVALQDFIVTGPDFAPTVLFIMAFSAIMFGCINAAREFVKEAPIYRRERAVNLGILPYMFSKIVVLGFFCLFQSLILVVCVAIFDPFHQGIFLPPFLEVYIVIALTSLVGLMLGLTVSALVSNNDRAMSFVPLILLPQVLFSGVIFPLSSWILQYLGLLFPIRWAMAALGSSIGLHSDKLNGDQLIEGVNTYQSTFFSTTNLQNAIHYLLLTWLALIAMLLILGAAIAFFLKRKDTLLRH